MFQYLVEVEMLLLMRYKVDAWTIESRMTIMDLQFYIKNLMFRIEEENKKSNKSGNRLMKSLIAIRDILNYMTLKEPDR